MSSRRRHRYENVDGVRIHWVELSPLRSMSARPPLVLLHGMNDCYRTWRHVGPRMARDRRVLIPDLPGHGLSDRPDVGYEIAWYARVMSRWLKAVGLSRCDVAGHSFGGGVAQMLLLECPERVRRLALVASGGLGREVSWLLRLAAMPMLVERIGQPLMGPCTRLALRAVGHPQRPTEAVRLSAFNEREGSARAFARTVRDVIGWNGQRKSFFDRAAEISRLPALGVFWGDADPVIPVTHAVALDGWVEGAKVTVFPRCGHYPHQECPKAFCAAVLQFLDDPMVRPAALRPRAGEAAA